MLVSCQYLSNGFFMHSPHFSVILVNDNQARQHAMRSAFFESCCMMLQCCRTPMLRSSMHHELEVSCRRSGQAAWEPTQVSEASSSSKAGPTGCRQPGGVSPRSVAASQIGGRSGGHLATPKRPRKQTWGQNCRDIFPSGGLLKSARLHYVIWSSC